MQASLQSNTFAVVGQSENKCEYKDRLNFVLYVVYFCKTMGLNVVGVKQNCSRLQISLIE